VNPDVNWRSSWVPTFTEGIREAASALNGGCLFLFKEQYYLTLAQSAHTLAVRLLGDRELEAGVVPWA
jgi:hypothetical protein